jgi:Zn-dependent peptidase ImmA (M78 family)
VELVAAKKKETKPQQEFDLKVIGKTYRLVVIDQPSLSIDAGARAYGTTDNRHQIISLAKDQGWDQLRETLIHELIHVWEQSYGVKIEHKDIYSLAMFWYALLRENPDMVQWIMQKDDRP